MKSTVQISAGLISLLSLVCVLMFVWPSCAPKQVASPTVTKRLPEETLFAAAEADYQRQKWEAAKNNYQRYLDMFPKGRFTAEALMKIGLIHRRLNEPVQAREAFQRLLAEHPQDTQARAAGMEIPFTYYASGDYQAALDTAARLEPQLSKKEDLLRIRLLTADAQLALGRSMDAARSYLDAYPLAGETLRPGILKRIETSLPSLADPEIKALSAAATPGSLPAAQIQYEMAMRNLRHEKFSSAALALTEFIEMYPSHPNAAEAQKLLDQLVESTFFRRDTIGCLLPLSGRYQMIGHRALRGIELALQRLIEIGLTPSPRLLIRDTGGDPQRASDAVRDLSKQGVAGIVGPMITADAATRTAQELEIPMLTLSPQEEIPVIGDYVFRNFLTSKMQVKEIVAYAFGDLGLHRFAVLYPADPYGRKLMNLFWDEVLAQGGKITALESYDPGNTDFADAIKKLVGLFYEVPADLVKNEPRPAMDPSARNVTENEPARNKRRGGEEDSPDPIIDFDAIFIPDSPKSAGLVLPQLAYYDVYGIYLFGTNLWHSPQLIEMAQDFVQGAILPVGYLPGGTEAAVKDFDDRFEAVYGEAPGFIEAVSYDCTMMMLQAASKDGLRFRSEIRDSLREIQFDGIAGFTVFDPSGEAQRPLQLLRILRDRFVPVERTAIGQEE